MLLLKLLLTFALLVVCSFAPGFFLIRQFRWSPLEKVCGSVGLSLLLVFLGAWVVYVTSAGKSTYWCLPAVCVALGVAARREMAKLFDSRTVRRVLGAYGVLVLWTLLILSTIRNYSGAAWFGDWLEHFQRALFFLDRFPVHTIFLGDYSLPARPPMMNVLAAFFLAQAGDRFEIFQAIFTILNLLIFLACCLLLPALGDKRRRGILPLACLFALNPVVIQNATYSWTKLFATFYVVLGLAFYLAGWRKRDGRRTVAAFVALSAGVLAHYSAAPYLVLLAGHYLFRRPGVKQLAAVAAVCGALLTVWIGWSVGIYGISGTFASNTTVTSSREYRGDPAEKFAGNLFDSLVPAVLRDPAAAKGFAQPNSAGEVRDNAFAFYQPNLIFGMGLVGGPVILYLLYGRLERRKECNAEGRFWLWFVPCAILAGILVVGERDPLGDAHLTLLPLEAVGIALLAGAMPLRRPLAAALVAGCIIDFGLGIFLQARVEHLENTPGETIFTGVAESGGTYSVGEAGPHSLSVQAGRNWFRKHQFELCQLWLGELASHTGNNASARQLADTLTPQLDEDRTAWQGWYARHGGRVEFLGDHVTGTAIADGAAIVLLLAGCAVWVKKLWDSGSGHLGKS